MYKEFREMTSKCLYMPVDLIDAIESRAKNDYQNFSKLCVDVLLKEFLRSPLENNKENPSDDKGAVKNDENK